jgi:subtilase family serine protease/photosystem II stability/assembly factor-like uncharacterized protein
VVLLTAPDGVARTRSVRRPTLPIAGFILLAVLGTIVPRHVGAEPSPAGPVVRVHGGGTWTPGLELALDEVQLIWVGSPRRAATPPVLLDGASVLQVSRDGAVVRLAAVASAAELVARAEALRQANPGWEARLVLYVPGARRGARSRHLLSEEIAVVAADGSVSREHAGDPLRTLEVAAAVAGRAGVGTAEPVVEAPDYLQQRLRRKIARLQRQDQPNEHQQFFAHKRVPPGVPQIPVERYFQAREQMKQMPLRSTGSGTTHPPAALLGMSFDAAARLFDAWTPLGPGNIGGRTRALVVDPADPRVLYAGGVAGGVWKTTNGGSSWTALTDTLLPNLAIASLAIDPAHPNVVYAGTGEGVFNGDAVRGAGIFKTSDGGASWTQLATTANRDFFFVNRIVAFSTGTVLAATGTGLWRSINAGATWTRVIDGTGVHGCLDVVAAPTYVLASCGTFAPAVLYRSADAGATFTAVLGPFESSFPNFGIGRTSIAIAPSDSRIAYALASSILPGSPYYLGLDAVYKSIDSGLTWTPTVTNGDATRLNTMLLTNPVYASFGACGFLGPPVQFFNQGWYDNAIAVDPTNPNRVWAGGIDLFRSDDGGFNWRLASFWWTGSSPGAYVHADQHTIVFAPDYATSGAMYVGNDGGIFKTTNGATGSPTTNVCTPTGVGITWTELNNDYGVTQFYHGAPYPGGETFLGGTQDNGTIRGATAGGVNAWAQILGGDGGYVAVDPANPNLIYAENTNGFFFKSSDGGASFGLRMVGLGAPDDFPFIAPFTMSPNNSSVLWIGGRQLYRTLNAAEQWAQASTQLGCGYVSAVAVAPGNDEFVLAGTDRGCVFWNTQATHTNQLTNWGPRWPINPGLMPPAISGYVSWLAFDPSNADTVYLTYSTFGVPHVWKSINGGQTWTNIDGSGSTGLPDVPVHTIVVDPGNPNRLFVGTDVGVFSSVDGGAHWAVENTGFANVITEALATGQVGGVTHLFAFTHGRGAWRVALPASAPDLAVTVATVAGTAVLPGGTVAVSNTVKNEGESAVGRPFVVGFALVPVDASGTPRGPDVTLDVTRTVDALDAGMTSAATTTVVIPSGTAAGAYKIRVLADATALIVEDPNPTNNDRLTGTLTVAIADLIVPSVTFTPAAGAPGATLSVTHTVKNVAPAPANAPASGSAIYLATNRSFSTVLGPALATVNVPAVGAGMMSPAVTKSGVHIPPSTPVGRYFLVVNANDGGAIVEADTANNAGASAAALLVGPDLVVSAGNATPAIVARGGTVTVTSTVKNHGGASTSVPVGVSFALVPQAAGADIPLGIVRTTAAPLAAGGSDAASTLVTIPADSPPGAYRIRIVADPADAVVEADETNNAMLATGVVTVALPDLVVTAVTAPASTAAGRVITVTNTVKNTGSVAAVGPFAIAFSVSADALLDGGDVALGVTRPLPSLGPQASSTAATAIMIPPATPPGVYRLLVRADPGNLVIEQDESNNVGASGPIVIGADLVVTAATPAPLIVAPGGTVTVTNTVKNQGGETTGVPFDVGFSLSNLTTAAETPLGVTRTVPPLGPGAVSTATTRLTIPAAAEPGIHNVLVTADVGNVVREASELNNVLASATIIVALPDVTVTTVTAPASTAGGRTISVANTVKNVGAVPTSAPVDVAFFLSVDTQHDDGDVPLGVTRTVGILPPQGVSSATTPLLIPPATAPGVYRVLVVADGANVLAEENETNNVGASGPLVIGPDLVVTAATATPTLVPAGGTVTVANTVKNQGGAPTETSFDVAFFLSSDAVFDRATDVPLRPGRTVLALVPGAVSSASSRLTIPPDTPAGSYRILVVADAGEVIAEASELNNVAASPPITVARADLVITSVTAPAVASTGTTIAVGTTVKNLGPVLTAGSITVTFFLSPDTLRDDADVPLGPNRVVTSLGPGAASTATSMLTIPIDTPSGIYRILAVANATGGGVEANEANNLGVSGPITLQAAPANR